MIEIYENEIRLSSEIIMYAKNEEIEMIRKIYEDIMIRKRRSESESASIKVATLLQ